MALHIADAEVDSLVTDLAKLERTTKTEALRQLLRKTIAERQRDAKRAAFRGVALRVMADAREKRIAPATKKEMDDLWGMDSANDGD